MNIIEQNKNKINGIFETFDRMIVNGYLLNLCNYRHFLFYLIQNNIKLKDFDKFALEQTSELCNHIDNYIKENNVETIYLNSGKIDKNEIVMNELNKNPNKTGLITALSVVEICNTMTVKPNHETEKLEVTSRPTKCKHYYFYFNDEEFGLMYLKIQTWFPYNVQIYINGREYLSKLLDKNNIKYEMYNNSFSYIEDFNKAQELADGILNKKISDSFDGLIEKINIHLPKIQNIFSHSYYWCIDQCEFATDINFKINNNQIKMYDKGNNLRIEVTINNPRDFKVLKTKENDDTGEVIETKEWVPMGKSISNLYRYVEISKSITKRYIEALPNINIDEVPLKDIQKISSRKEVNNRIYSSFNILNEDTLNLFTEISKGEYLINGFNNKMIRKNLYSNSEDKKIINKVTRTLSKLKAHGIIKKVSRKNKYYLTTNGRNIISSILLYTRKQLLT